MSDLSEIEEPDSPCGWPLMAAVRPAIETRRLILRPPVDEDAETIARLANSAAVAHNLVGMPYPYRIEHARLWLAEPVDPRGQRHLICRKGFDAAPTPIGVLTLDMRGRVGPGWIGCWLGKRHWGQGFATEACHAAIDYAFVHQRHEKLLFACRVTNPAGRRGDREVRFPDGGARAGLSGRKRRRSGHRPLPHRSQHLGEYQGLGAFARPRP